MCSGNWICDSKLSLIHSNIRSIPSNLSNLTSYLENLNSKFSVMAFTETWLKEYNHETYGITGYNAVHNYRTTKIGGGVALYVKDCVDFNVRHDLFNSSEHIESAFIEIDKDCVGTGSKLIIGVIYRLPDTDISLFNESLCNILSGYKLKINYVTC